jgi:hypothetical protein
MRARSNSDPLKSTATGRVRPSTLYFYCTAGDYADIVRDNAIWVSGGVPAPAADTTHGGFPVGAYASSTIPSVVRAGIAQFVAQWYGGFAIVLTHYVAFRIDDGWQPEGHNLMTPGTAAQFGWHWVNPHHNRNMTRSGASRQAVAVHITDHGLF